MEEFLIFFVVALIIVFVVFITWYLYIITKFGNFDRYYWYKTWKKAIKKYLSLVKSDYIDRKDLKAGDKIKEIKKKLKELWIEAEVKNIKEALKDIEKKSTVEYKAFSKLEPSPLPSLPKVEEEKTIFESISSRGFLKSVWESIGRANASLSENLLSILKLAFALLLFVWDIYASTKLWQDIYAKEISEWALYMWISFEYLGLVVGIFIPLLFFFIFDLIIEKRKAWNAGAKMLEYMILFFTFLLVLAGLFVLYASRILPEIPFNFEPIDVIMMLFFIPATLVVAYIFNDLKAWKKSISFIFAPFEIIIKYIVYFVCLVFCYITEAFRRIFWIWEKKQSSDKISNNKEMQDSYYLDLKSRLINIESGFEMAIDEKIEF